MTLFILLFIIERVYESYYTSKDIGNSNNIHDKHLRNVIVAYTVMVTMAILEFYILKHRIRMDFLIVGIVLLTISLYLRVKTINTLGKDWSIQTFATPSTIKRNATYKFLRHPYYLGVALEAIAFPLILNSFYSLFLSILFVIPLEAYRGFLEEKTLIDKFGWPYIKFRREVNACIPSFISYECFERRNDQKPISQNRRVEVERRKKELDVTIKDRRKLTRT